MSTVSALRGALDALTGRVIHATGPDHHRLAASRGRSATGVEDERDELAQVLYLSEQGFWGSGRRDGAPHGTAWGTSIERYLRDKYLERADAILAAGFRKSPTFTREAVEVAHRSEGSTTDPDEWIVVAWALGIEVGAGG